MARSDYVYVVLAQVLAYPPYPAAAFTVKHELASWLYKQESTDNLRVFRVNDSMLCAKEPALLELAPLIRQGYEKAHEQWRHSSPEWRGEEPKLPA